ncbi:MAG: hypothetical protein ACIAQF_09255 [Phycisphaerales bacterium JB065]
MKRLMYLFVLGLLIQPIAAAEDGRTIEELIEDLRDDDVRWNAHDAIDAIWSMENPPIAELEQALHSDDWQQRQIAALLRWRYIPPHSWLRQSKQVTEDRRQEAEQISKRLIEVTVEGLRSDNLPYDKEQGRYLDVFNASRGFLSLIYHADLAQEELEGALESDDYQQKFLSAVILGTGGVTASAEKAAPILIPHLRDNDIPEDARLAIYALHSLGESVIPLLEAALPTADKQQSDAILLLLLDFRDPPESMPDFYARKKLQDITDKVHDPAVQFSYVTAYWLHQFNRSQWLADRGEIPQPEPRPSR